MATPDRQANEEPPLTELESIQLKINQVTDESLESTRHMLSLVKDAQGVGTKTLDTGIEKCVDYAFAHETGGQKSETLMHLGHQTLSQVVKTISQPAGKCSGGNVPDAGASSGNQQYIRRINNDAREDEMEENMQAVGSILGNLKSMATDMGTEIEKQNTELDRICGTR